MDGEVYRLAETGMTLELYSMNFIGGSSNLRLLIMEFISNCSIFLSDY